VIRCTGLPPRPPRATRGRPRRTPRKRSPAISTRIFVGNLAFTTTADQLRELFAASGEVVDVALPTDKFDGRPRGFAFVEMATPEQGTEAVARMDGTEVDGRVLRVNDAEQRPSGPRAGGGAGDRFGADRPSMRARPKGSRRNMRARKRGF
jgi:cold-inducible RNA-binding protein